MSSVVPAGERLIYILSKGNNVFVFYFIFFVHWSYLCFVYFIKNLNFHTSTQFMFHLHDIADLLNRKNCMHIFYSHIDRICVRYIIRIGNWYVQNCHLEGSYTLLNPLHFFFFYFFIFITIIYFLCGGLKI